MSGKNRLVTIPLKQHDLDHEIERFLNANFSLVSSLSNAKGLLSEKERGANLAEQEVITVKKLNAK